MYVILGSCLFYRVGPWFKATILYGIKAIASVSPLLLRFCFFNSIICKFFLPVVPNRQPSSQRRLAGRVSVLPALLPVVSGGWTTCGSAGHLEGGVSPTQSQRRRLRCAGFLQAAGTTLPPHRGAGMEITVFFGLEGALQIFRFSQKSTVRLIIRCALLCLLILVVFTVLVGLC